MSSIHVVKIGGNIIDEPARLQHFLQDFAALEAPKILVHGGGKIATGIGERLGISAHYVEGRRVTDEATLELVTMVYGGLVNKRIVAALQSIGCNALGLTGADGNCIRAQRRAAAGVDYGFAGDVPEGGVNADWLRSLLQQGITPVLAPLTHDGKGSLLNTNADTIAQEAAKALACSDSVRLIYCFERPGVLRNAGDDSSVIRCIREEDFSVLREAGIVNGGMIPKLSNAFAALHAGVQEIIIGKAEAFTQLIEGKAGTLIQ